MRRQRVGVEPERGRLRPGGFRPKRFAGLTPVPVAPARRPVLVRATAPVLGIALFALAAGVLLPDTAEPDRPFLAPPRLAAPLRRLPRCAQGVRRGHLPDRARNHAALISFRHIDLTFPTPTMA